MTIQIYNTLGRKKEFFEPMKAGKVGMYVCGPTVYDSSHIGHARSVVVFDVIARYLRARGFDVTYVRNFTDVDDKIINRAKLLGIDSREVSERYIREFHEDMDSLNVERANVEPKVTDHISDIIQFVQILLDKKIAYPIDGDVYYSVEAFKEYGKLSGRKLEEMEAGARVEVDERKRNPFDFALWKAAKPDEPAWDSPWGKGRPGWHIECSAMSHKYLGESFDIHGGGKDLIFPHHENEIAQSEGAFDKPFAKYWIHNGFININQEKMSKSLGNFLVVRDVLKKYDPESIRLFLLSNHYRSPIDFTDKAIFEAGLNLDKIYAVIERSQKEGGQLSVVSDQKATDHSSYWDSFVSAMDDDFNTARGIGVLFEAVRDLNRMLDDQLKNITSDILSDIQKICGVLGILTQSPESYFEKKRSKAVEKTAVDPVLIEKMINDRATARKAKDFKTADRIRKELQNINVVLEDRPQGTIWKIEA